jgi:hypothetical protein
VLADADDVAVPVAEDASVAGRVVEVRGEHRQLLRVSPGRRCAPREHERRDRLRLEQGHVAREDDDVSFVALERRHRAPRRVAGALLLVLDDGLDLAAEAHREIFLDELARVPDDDDDARGPSAPRRAHDVREHGQARDLVENLRQRALHARALTSSEDDRSERLAHGRASYHGVRAGHAGESGQWAAPRRAEVTSGHAGASGLVGSVGMAGRGARDGGGGVGLDA